MKKDKYTQIDGPADIDGNRGVQVFISGEGTEHKELLRQHRGRKPVPGKKAQA